MATSGETISFADYERRCNRVAHLFRDLGLQRLDHVAFLMENNPRMLEVTGGAERTGLYFTCINSYLSPEEVAYIVNDSDAQVLISSAAKREVAAALPPLVSEGAPLPHGRRHRRRAGRATRTRLPRYPDTNVHGRATRRRDVVLVGHDGTAEGDPAPDAGAGTEQAARRDGVRQGHVRVPRRDDVSVARAAVPLGPAGERGGDAATRIDSRDHGALRSRAVPATRRALRRHELADGPDDVLAAVEAAGRREGTSTTCRRSRRSCTRLRRVPFRSRKR